MEIDFTESNIYCNKYWFLYDRYKHTIVAVAVIAEKKQTIAAKAKIQRLI